MRTKEYVLLVEDDRRLGDLITEYLTKNQFTVSIERRGDTAPKRILNEQPDLVILDLMLPGMDGLEVCRTVRPDYQGPILMLTAREDDMDQVAGLEMGADDYVKKPVEPRVLLARIRALMRRFHHSNNMPDGKEQSVQANELIFGSLLINKSSRSVYLAGNSVTLTTNEFDLLWLLAEASGHILDRETLYMKLRGIEYDGLDRSVDLAVSRLRKKLENDPDNPQGIKTVWGQGYLFVPDIW
ncbi:response regulator [Desulfogranum japonicum]|uniref:response regulator n=1 Tax=Desulfogranum japonicum TaxID=231447 RepID=UPI0003FAEE0E|nr:response regulator [Desulfogranum japonicum]